MTQTSRAAVLIAGPTASGKSALALDLAGRIGGVIVNADAMQVYRDLRVLTARPTAADEKQVPHRLYGHVDGAVNYSVGRYIDDAARVIAAARAADEPLIVVGGTGLYFKALLEGLSRIPPVPQRVRDQVRAQAQGRSTADLYADLAACDPETARGLTPGDRLRIQRALEVLAATGRPLSSFRGQKQAGPLLTSDAVRIFLAPDRGWLRARIDTRFATMIEEGAFDEARALAARNLDPALPIMRAHGVPPLLAHLNGAMTLEAAIAQGQADTRRYVKRQFTWFRHQMPGWTWVAPERALSVIEPALAKRAATIGT